MLCPNNTIISNDMKQEKTVFTYEKQEPDIFA